LLEFLRYNLKNYNIAFRFEVDASLMDNTEEKPMTKEEIDRTHQSKLTRQPNYSEVGFKIDE
jgi:hypothetical protein